MNNENNEFNNWVITKYYIFCTITQIIWSIAILGFTIFLVNFFNNPWYLFFTALIFAKPYILLDWKRKKDLEDSTDEKKHKPSDYGTNNPL